MLRVGGITLPNKRILYALPYLHGVGYPRAKKLLSEAGIDPMKKMNDLTPDEEQKLRGLIESGSKIEGELRREVMGHIRRLKEIGSYRGSRHAKRLPVRGQRTKTNSRTVRGNVRKTMGSGRKPTAQKT